MVIRSNMAVSRSDIPLCIVAILSALILGTLGSNFAPCPSGWETYEKEMPTTCLFVSSSTVNTLNEAHKKCVGMDSSLMTIDSDQKMARLDAIVGRLSRYYRKVWIGLQKFSDGEVRWLTKDGSIPATSRPSKMRYYGWEYLGSSYNMMGLIYHSGSLSSPQNMGYEGGESHYICEKRAKCIKGRYGLACDKECHCHGQECDPTSLDNMTCATGCAVGWMGEGCSIAMEDADVGYFCVNSQDQGQYATVKISTKNVHYDNIVAVDENGGVISWCNNTIIETHSQLHIVTIKIFIGNNTHQDMEEGRCAGKVGGKGKYEWQIKIQEKDGIVSRNDQEVNIECDFTDGDTLQVMGDTEIEEESWFMRSNIKKPVQYLKEKKEKVKLSVVDPAAGDETSETKIGSSVLLRIDFGLKEGNLAQGVIPYDCDALSADDEHRIRFLDWQSCPLEGFPISAFSRNGTSKSLSTQPFRLFAFDGHDQVDFKCSYILCFEDEPCDPGCDKNRTMSRVYNLDFRHKRSAGVRPQRIKGTITVNNDKMW